MKLEKFIYLLLAIILFLLAVLVIQNAISNEALTYENINLPANASLAGICKDGKILEGLRCDPEITCCK